MLKHAPLKFSLSGFLGALLLSLSTIASPSPYRDTCLKSAALPGGVPLAAFKECAVIVTQASSDCLSFLNTNRTKGSTVPVSALLISACSGVRTEKSLGCVEKIQLENTGDEDLSVKVHDCVKPLDRAAAAKDLIL